MNKLIVTLQGAGSRLPRHPYLITAEKYDRSFGGNPARVVRSDGFLDWVDTDHMALC